LAVDMGSERGRMTEVMLTSSIAKWDRWFLGLAKYVSTASKDPSTKTGAVIVRPDHTVASVGYNGFPMRMEDKLEWLNDREGEKYQRMVHSDVNAILHANGPVIGYTFYGWPIAPCHRCAVTIIQAGIDRVVFPAPSEDALSRWAESFARTKSYLNDADIPWMEYNLEEA
jgi:dCMP deaminase